MAGEMRGVSMVDHTPSFSPGNLLTLLFSQSSKSCDSIQLSESSQRQISETDLGSQPIILFINIHSPPIFTNAQLLFLGHLLHFSIMSFVSERSGGCEYERSYEGFEVSSASSCHQPRASNRFRKEMMSLLLWEHVLQLEKSTEIGRMLDRCTYPQPL